jgi:predicted HD superfamily hydrolase involved in NAD metabolism
MDIDYIMKDMEKNLSKKRFAHSIGTMKYAEKLAISYGENTEKVKLAAILHDCAKELNYKETMEYVEKYKISELMDEPNNIKIYHGAIGAVISKNKYGIEDEYILNAITWHTTGKKNMTLLDKIIYVSDLVEEDTRDYPDIRFYRELSLKDINKTMILAINFVIEKLIEKNQTININTIEARNDLILEKKGVSLK